MKLTIEGKDYPFPQRLTVEQWIDLMGWDFEDPKAHARILQISTGAPLKALQLIPQDGLELGVALTFGLMENRAEAPFRDVNTLKFGEWVDLEVGFATGVTQSLQEMLNILAPKIGHSDEALWVIDQYSSWRTSLFRQYANLFGINDVEEEEEEAVRDPYSAQRAWYRIIVSLAGDDLLKIDSVVEQPVVKVLNFMALQKQKQLEENAKILQQKRNYDLQRTRR